MEVAGDSTLAEQLTCHRSSGVDVLLTVEILVCILHPAHDLFVGSHVRAEHVFLWPDESFLGKLVCIFTGDPLDLGLRVFCWVKPNSTERTSEWNVCEHEFEGIKRG